MKNNLLSQIQVIYQVRLKHHRFYKRVVSYQISHIKLRMIRIVNPFLPIKVILKNQLLSSL